MYQWDCLPQHQLCKPVVSIGNLTVGGTGKTPFVMWLATFLHSKGKRVAILSRGYGRSKATGNVLVSDGNGVMQDWRVAGDEPTMIARHCPWAIVAVGPNRYDLGVWVLEQVECDCFVLDDGYQHLQLHRDLDILLFDATDVKGLSGMLPAGRLREPLATARHADVIGLTNSRTHTISQPVQACLEHALAQSISPMVLMNTPKYLQHLVTLEMHPVEFLFNVPLLVVSGIANPRSFRDSLLDCGLQVHQEVRFPDHCAYDEADVQYIRQKMADSQCLGVMMTEKDSVKLQEWFSREEAVWFLVMDVRFVAGENIVEEHLQQMGML